MKSKFRGKSEKRKPKNGYFSEKESDEDLSKVKKQKKVFLLLVIWNLYKKIVVGSKKFTNLNVLL